MKFLVSRVTAIALLGVILSTILITGCGNKEESAPAADVSSNAATTGNTAPTGDSGEWKVGMPRTKK